MDAWRMDGLFRLWLARVDRRLNRLTEGAHSTRSLTYGWRELWESGTSEDTAAELALGDANWEYFGDTFTGLEA